MDLADLYRDVILDHNRRPRNFGPLEAADASAEGVNPLCGDRLALRLKLDADRIEDIRFEGQGCAISTASASLMTEAVKGRTRAEALEIFDRVHRLLTEEEASSDDLGKLAALSGVREYPSRVKCASLCWHTLVSALNSRGTTQAPAVSTE
jgi:nitrogen fixation protein NifU and related proteins